MAVYELDGQAPEFPEDGLFWVAETAIEFKDFYLVIRYIVLIR